MRHGRGPPGQGVPARCCAVRPSALRLLIHEPPLATIRSASAADWPLADLLHRACSEANMVLRWGRPGVVRRDFARLLEHGEVWIGLGADGRPLAMVSVGPVSREAGVVDLGLQVADAHQRRGIGTLLTWHAADHAHRLGAHTLAAYTDASNTPMLRLLARLGPAVHTRDGSHLDVRVRLGDAPAGHGSW
ncbi:GNAT family N-acetyltransferase [Streptomyces sp. NPDC002680]|uniref:GNAT family N-acetyltransferase n=1 Tax=Streptomyces sp. NPDC002680 TaxID=3364659 RepID=UPI0036957455